MPEEVFLKGDRIALRRMDAADREFVARQWNDAATRQQAGWPLTPISGDYVEEVTEHGDDAAQFVVCRDDDRLGFVSVFDIDWNDRNAELSYLIRPEEHGNGYATEAAEVCVEHAFDELGLHEVYATVWAENEASMAVLERVRFEEEGVLREHLAGHGGYTDQHWFGLLTADH